MAAQAIALLFARAITKGFVRASANSANSGAAVVGKAWKELSRKLIAQTLKGGTAALKNAAGDLKQRAQALTPEDTGALVRSARIDRVGRANEPGFVVSFGSEGPSAGYALEVHEGNQSPGPITRQKSSDDGKAGRKYLERPYRRHKDRYVEEVAFGIKTAISKG